MFSFASVGKVITSKDIPTPLCIRRVNICFIRVCTRTILDAMYIQTILIWLHLLMWLKLYFRKRNWFPICLPAIMLHGLFTRTTMKFHANVKNGFSLWEHRTTIYAIKSIDWIVWNYHFIIQHQVALRSWSSGVKKEFWLVEYLIRIHVSYSIVNYFECSIYRHQLESKFMGL